MNRLLLKWSTTLSCYHLFVGLHNLLMGLLPVFLPVYLLKTGSNLAQICQVVGWSGFGFCMTLFLLDRFRQQSCLKWIYGGFLLELIVLVLLVLHVPPVVLGIVNGGYACLYWTMQRILFLDAGGLRDSGRRFGNFQIYVLVVLKVSIFIGSFMLERVGPLPLILISCCITGAGIQIFARRGTFEFPLSLQGLPVLRIGEVAGFSDAHHSRFIFTIDGIFLYLESYFWLISLFLVVGENFFRLGLLIILLALCLAGLFFFIRARIDRSDQVKIFRWAVLAYSVSWMMRAVLDKFSSSSLLLVWLLVIAFLTSFFRLAFNKRFFDLATEEFGYRYLFFKSYHSQWWLGICFLGLAGLLSAGIVPMGGIFLLRWIYWGAAILALCYLLYLPVQESSAGTSASLQRR